MLVVIDGNLLACVAGAWKLWAKERTGAREGDAGGCLHYALCLFLFETNSKIKQVPNYGHTYKAEDKNKL